MSLPASRPDELKARIGGYDGLAVRSATKVTGGLLARAEKLKVIGRAGIGVDNIDVAAATQRGIVVMNTPYGNSITAAEHAIAMLFALCRADPGGRPLDPGRQMGEVALHGGRADRQDARRHRLRQYRLDRRRARPGSADEGDRLRSVPVARARRRSRHREGLARRALCPRRFHHPAHAADRGDPQPDRRRRDRQDEARRAPHQLRARRPRRRG